MVMFGETAMTVPSIVTVVVCAGNTESTFIFPDGICARVAPACCENESPADSGVASIRTSSSVAKMDTFSSIVISLS